MVNPFGPVRTPRLSMSTLPREILFNCQQWPPSVQNHKPRMPVSPLPHFLSPPSSTGSSTDRQIVQLSLLFRVHDFHAVNVQCVRGIHTPNSLLSAWQSSVVV